MAGKAKNLKADDPWATARMEWNAHEGYVVASKRRWQIVGLLFAFITMLAIGGIISIGSQSKFIPYVVQVNKLGEALAVKRADLATPLDPRIIHATLANFIHDLRFVTPDVALQKKAIFNIYAYLNSNDAATTKLNEFFNNDGTNPFKRAELETVNIEINSIIQLTRDSWQVFWSEETRTRDGKKLGDSSFRANITIYVSPATSDRSEDDIQKNPLGILVKDIYISPAN